MDDLALAHTLANAASALALSHLASAPIRVERKQDGSVVTAADRAVEEMIYETLQRERPHDGFLGEESGARGVGRRRWIVDGIDGTSSFVTGGHQWGTMIALEDEDELVVGVAEAPMLGRRWWATRGRGAYLLDRRQPSSRTPSRLHVSHTMTLEDARVGIGPPAASVVGWGATIVAELASRSLFRAEGGDYALLIAEDQLDAFLFLGGAPWDYAAMAIIVEEAGGWWSDLAGSRQLDRGALVVTNMHIHEEVIELTRRLASPS